jgi:RNA polymerase sigma factor (TIGR02999 family)
MPKSRLIPSADLNRIEEKEMGTDQRGNVTLLLADVRAGREGAHEELVQAIYGELRRMAGGLMRGERPDHTLQPSALVNEALLALLEGESLADVPNRRYLFAAAAEAMRRVLVDHAQRRRAKKRIGNRVRVPLDQTLAILDEQGVDVIALHEALDQLTEAHPRQAQVVKLRFFGGLTVPEVAEALEVSATTIESDWRFARAWLKGRLGACEG